MASFRGAVSLREIATGLASHTAPGCITWEPARCSAPPWPMPTPGGRARCLPACLLKWLSVPGAVCAGPSATVSLSDRIPPACGLSEASAEWASSAGRGLMAPRCTSFILIPMADTGIRSTPRSATAKIGNDIHRGPGDADRKARPFGAEPRSSRRLVEWIRWTHRRRGPGANRAPARLTISANKHGKHHTRPPGVGIGQVRFRN